MTVTNGSGGKVDARYLVSLGCWDDDFDTDNGYRDGYSLLLLSVTRNTPINHVRTVLSRIITVQVA